jgi:tetratricopeptide (TPR) repeat protein
MTQETSPSDSDKLFDRAVQDYTQNRFTSAQAEFEKVQGTHAQEAKQYITKIKSYTDDVQVAKSIMARSVDELDASSMEYAIGKYEEALKIKSDGPWGVAQELEKAKAHYSQLVQEHSKDREKRDRDFCTNALAAVRQHNYREAKLNSCPLAHDDPAYSCGGDEAVNLCHQMSELADASPQGDPPVRQPAISAPDKGSVIDMGMAAYEKNDFERARTLFNRAPAELKSAADEYLDRIARYQGLMAQAEKLNDTADYEQARTAFTNAASVKPDGPGNPRAQASLMELEQGIDQFYSGDYVSAIHNLESYAQESSEREPLAHFYLGASKLARFFVTGNEDANLQRDAMNELKKAKQAGFKAKAQDVSPKILQAYNSL